jgi:hypothetical protein
MTDDKPIPRQPRTSLVLGWRLAAFALLVGLLTPPACVMLLR